jgi:hypothetical protein
VVVLVVVPPHKAFPALSIATISPNTPTPMARS